LLYLSALATNSLITYLLVYFAVVTGNNSKCLLAADYSLTYCWLQELLATRDKLTHAEVRCQSLTAEKERLKSSEAHLVSENEMLHRNQQTRDQLVISLEAIQVWILSELYS